MNSWEPLIINAAITGAIHSKEDNRHIPITVDEIVADAGRCRDAGATIVHVHARDSDGRATYKGEVYFEIISRIRSSYPDLIICGSTSGRIFNDVNLRMSVLELSPDCRPDLASLSLGSFNFRDGPSMNSPDTIYALAKGMLSRGIVPEMEIFELGMAEFACHLVKKGILSGPLYANLILGSLGTLSATPFNLVSLVNSIPPGTVWSAGGLGRYQFRVNCLAITMGGHVRVGLEDSLYYDEEKKQLATNAGLIDRIVKVSRAVGREIASPSQARSIIGLRQISRETL